MNEKQQNEEIVKIAESLGVTESEFNTIKSSKFIVVYKIGVGLTIQHLCHETKTVIDVTDSVFDLVKRLR